MHFNPRLPWGRRHTYEFVKQMQKEISIHAFRGEGDWDVLDAHQYRYISIHAFRGEGDAVLNLTGMRQAISIHAFRGEGDLHISGVVVICI